MIPQDCGIMPPTITPLGGGDALGTGGLGRLAGRMIAGGVSSIFASGTSGEAPGLSRRLRREVVEFEALYSVGPFGSAMYNGNRCDLRCSAAATISWHHRSTGPTKQSASASWSRSG